MAITLDQPQLSYDINRYYNHLLSKLADKNVYDVSKAAIAFKNPAIGPALNSADGQNNVGSSLSIGVHYYVVVANLLHGESLQSREVSVDIQAPNNSALVTWSIVPGAQSYKVFRTEISGNYRNTFIGETANGFVNTFLDTGIVPTQVSPLASIVKITGTVTPAAAYDIQLFLKNGDERFSLFAQKPSQPDGTFVIEVSVPRGQNELYIQVGPNRSQSVFINAYNLHVYLEMIADELLTYWQDDIEQIRADIHIDPTEDFLDSELRSPTQLALKEFWQVMTSIIRPSLYTDIQYISLLKTVLDAYKNATSFKAIKQIIQEIISTWDTKSFIPFDKENSGFRLGNKLKFSVVREAPGVAWTQETSNALFTERIRHVSVVFNNLMWVIGGEDSGGETSDVWYSADGITWTQATGVAPWGPRSSMVVLVYDGYMWLIGGYDGVSTLNDVWKSNDGVIWTQETVAASFPTRMLHAGAVHKSKMWITGGEDSGTAKSDVWYSTDGINWIEALPTFFTFPTSTRHKVVSYGGRLFAVMGYNAGFLNHVYQSIDGIDWFLLTIFPVATADHTVTIHNNRMYLIGGTTGSGDVNTIWVSDLLSIGAWGQIIQTSPLTGRSKHTALSYQNKLFVIAGVGIATDDDVWSTQIGGKSLEYSWTGGLLPFNNQKRYIVQGTNVVLPDPGIQRCEIIYVDGVVDSDGYWELKIIEQPITTLMDAPLLPQNVKVLAVLRIDDDDIIHIAGQGRLADSLSTFVGNGSGPFLMGPTYVTDTARIRSRGYKYSRMAIYLSDLNPVDPDYSIKVTMLKNLLKDVKPAKMTIVLGIPPSTLFAQEI